MSVCVWSAQAKRDHNQIFQQWLFLPSCFSFDEKWWIRCVPTNTAKTKKYRTNLCVYCVNVIRLRCVEPLCICQPHFRSCPINHGPRASLQKPHYMYILGSIHSLLSINSQVHTQKQINFSKMDHFFYAHSIYIDTSWTNETDFDNHPHLIQKTCNLTYIQAVEIIIFWKDLEKNNFM